jgi:hypothetical protein
MSARQIQRIDARAQRTVVQLHRRLP